MEFKGTPLKSDEFEKMFKEAWKPKARYSWNAGVAIGRYLAELKNGKLVGRKCNKCGRTMIPPRMFCEQCFRETDEWVYLQDTGTVATFAISYLATDASRLKEPIIPAVVEIDGASKGMGILHILKCDPKQAKIGMRVRAKWRAERTGSIRDIEYFEAI